MYARFTERARQVVALAQDAARDLGHERVGTEHLLLGLSAEQKGLAGWTTGSTLETLGRDFEDLQAAIERIAGRGERPTVGQMAFTGAAQCAVELANVEVDRRRLNFVGTEHLLLGLLDQLDAEPTGDVALQALTELQVTTRQVRETVERFVPACKGGLSWMLRRTPGVEFRGVRGAGWIDVLSLQAEAHLRRLLLRAGAVAMDDGRTVVETRDLLAAFSDLPAGAKRLQLAGVTPARADRTATLAERDWTQVDAGERVLAALVAAQRGAIDRKATMVTVDDLLLALATEQATLLRCSGWELSPLRALLERRDMADAT